MHCKTTLRKSGRHATVLLARFTSPTATLASQVRARAQAGGHFSEHYEGRRARVPDKPSEISLVNFEGITRTEYGSGVRNDADHLAVLVEALDVKIVPLGA